jgi:hypothetical protein
VERILTTSKDPVRETAQRKNSVSCTTGIICDVKHWGGGAVYDITRNENTTFSNSQTIIVPGFVVLSVEKQFPHPCPWSLRCRVAHVLQADEWPKAISFPALLNSFRYCLASRAQLMNGIWGIVPFRALLLRILEVTYSNLGQSASEQFIPRSRVLLQKLLRGSRNSLPCMELRNSST